MAEVIKNLWNQRASSSEFYINTKEMAEDIYSCSGVGVKLVEGVDYIKVYIDESLLNETQECPNCNNKNAKKYGSLILIAEGKENVRCSNCNDKADPLDDLVNMLYKEFN